MVYTKVYKDVDSSFFMMMLCRYSRYAINIIAWINTRVPQYILLTYNIVY